MRVVVVVTAVLSLALLGGKCKGPKKPNGPAHDAVEEAWFAAEVDAQLDESFVVDVEVVDAEDDIAVVRFTRVGSDTEASVTLDGERFVFAVLPDGSIVEMPIDE